MPWTDDRIATLRKLWNEGHSASIIAGNLGEFSRNAVIGKARRLGLASRRDIPVLRRNARKPSLFTARSRSPKAHMPPFLPRRRRAQEGQQAKPALKIETPAHPIAEPSPASNVTIMALNSGACRWPLGDPKTSSFRYCGGPSKPGCSYCTYHAEIAYRRG
jgi:GcrA cell cycle regulator